MRHVFHINFKTSSVALQLSSSHYVLSVCPDWLVRLKEIHVDQIIVLIQPYLVY